MEAGAALLDFLPTLSGDTMFEEEHPSRIKPNAPKTMASLIDFLIVKIIPLPYHKGKAKDF